jgi:hypothetical protein
MSELKNQGMRLARKQIPFIPARQTYNAGTPAPALHNQSTQRTKEKEHWGQGSLVVFMPDKGNAIICNSYLLSS